MAITVQKLKQLVKENKIPEILIFYGEEKYLRDSYTEQIKKAALSGGIEEFNFDLFEGDNADFDLFIAAVNSFPQMADKKVIIAKNTKFLKEDGYKESILSLMEQPPKYAVVIFVEDDTRKVKKDIMRTGEQKGYAVNFEKQRPTDLRAWVSRKLNQSGKDMSNPDMEYLVEICEMSLSRLDLECNKLIAYSGERKTVTRKDIDEMVPVSAEYKIFNMVNMLLEGQSEKAYGLLRELKLNREQPTVIISSIYSQLSIIFMCKMLSLERKNPADFLPANRKFLATKYAGAHSRYSKEYLRNIMKLCAEYDVGIKTGKIEAFTALEIIMAEMLGRNG